MAPLDHASLLGLPLTDALDRLQAADHAPPVVVRSQPPRPRHPFPPDARWRVARVNASTPLTLVIVPTIEGPPC